MKSCDHCFYIYIEDYSRVVSCSISVEQSYLYVIITWANAFLFPKYVQ